MSSRTVFRIVLVFLLAASTSAFGQNKTSTKSTPAKANQPVPSPEFIEGKTIIDDIVFTRLDSDYPDSDEFVRSAPLSDLKRELRENRCSIEANDKFDSRKIEQTIKIVSRFLFDLGFLDAKVVALGQKLPKDRMKLTFAVEKGKPIWISRFVFTGTKYFNNEELKNALILCLGDDWGESAARKIKYCVDRDVRGFMFSKGYLKAKINQIGKRFVKNDLEILVDVNEGTVHRFGEITVEGAKVFSTKEILEMFGKQPGDIVNGQELQEYAYETLPKLYGERGYVQFADEFDVEFVEPVTKDADPTVNIKFTLDEGQRSKVAAFEFVGLSREDSRDLVEGFPFKTGEYYVKSKLASWCKKINEAERYKYLDCDQDIEVLVSEEQPDIKILIKVSLKE